MKTMTYVDIHSASEAFLGNRLSRLVDLIVEQGDGLLRQGGISFPARASSAVLLIEEYENLSTADIARLLGQPHQLVTQRIDLLIDLGLVERRSDQQDGRRKILALTAKGAREAIVLHACLNRAEQVFAELYDEIGVNLSKITQRAILALADNSLQDRFGANWSDNTQAILQGRRTTQRNKSPCVT